MQVRVDLSKAHLDGKWLIEPSLIPFNTEIDWSPELCSKFEAANYALGQLNAAITLLPFASYFVKILILKEAVFSLRIDDAQVSVHDLLLWELGQKNVEQQREDVRVVYNYATALERIAKSLSHENKVSQSLIKKIHQILYQKLDSRKYNAGEYRQNIQDYDIEYYLDAVFAPPHPEVIPECIKKILQFINEEPGLIPPLHKIAVAWPHFDAIFPFSVGSSQTGRILASLMFCENLLLKKPCLSLSSCLYEHRSEYFEALSDIRKGDWQTWFLFFATAVHVSAMCAFDTVSNLAELVQEDKKCIETLGRAKNSCQVIYQLLLEYPIVSTSWLVEKTEFTSVTVNKGLEHLQRLNILEEFTGKRRYRLFKYSRYIEIATNNSGE